LDIDVKASQQSTYADVQSA